MKEREKLRQEKVVQEKRLRNPFIKPAFGLGLLGTILVLFPAGIENQMQWWYLIPTFLCGILGYVINYKARKLNCRPLSSLSCQRSAKPHEGRTVFICLHPLWGNDHDHYCPSDLLSIILFT